MNFSPEQKIVNEQKINIMNLSTKEIGQPELKLNSEPEADSPPSAQVSANAFVIGGFVKGDKVVWDSHFGYEIGYFLGEGVMFNTYLIDVCTGVIIGPCSHSKNEIHKYSDELIDSLTKKYKYEKRFSETF